MKLKILFLSCVLVFGSLFGSIPTSGPSIVFVHIGEEVPTYLETAVKQARLFNSCTIIVVANEKALQHSQKDLEKYNAVCVPCESLVKTKEHATFIQNSKLDKKFRGGFWSYATERFFYLQDLMQNYQLKEVVHLENDVMIYVDISSLLPVFQKRYPHIGMTLDNDNRCIPGFVYVADDESMTHLAQFMCMQVRDGKNDMQSLALYHQQYGTLYSDKLPIIMNSYVKAHELVSPCKFRVKNKWTYCNHEDKFLSIFDAAALGQYLGGIDPRNDPSAKPGFINESCVFNPSLLQFSWKCDAQGRKVPYAKYGDTDCRINNLHIHSKRLPLFLSDREEA